MATARNTAQQKQIEASAALRDAETKRDQAQLAYREALRGGGDATNERSTYDSLTQRVASLRTEVDKAERELAAEIAKEEGFKAQAGRNQAAGITNLPPGGFSDREDGAAALRFDTSSTAAPDRIAVALQKLYAGAPQSSPEAFEGAIVAAMGGAPNARYLASLGGEFSGPDGGFAVPIETTRQIFAHALEQSLLVRLGAQVFPMASNELEVPVVSDYTETGGEVAGLTAGWTAEGAEASSQLMTVQKLALAAKKLIVLCNVTNELGDDSPAYVQKLPGVMSAAIARRVDLGLLRGTGAGQPLGVISSPAAVTVTKEGGQAADTVIWRNVTKMWAALAPGSHERAVWLSSPSTLPQLLEMGVPIGTAGALVPYIQATADGGWAILGRPVVITSLLPALGDVGDLILLDPTQLAVGLRRALAIESSPHPLFSSDVLTFRAKWRGDLAPVWSKKRTTYDGRTVSPYVLLEAR